MPGAGAASKATTISKRAMKSRVRQSSEPEPPLPAALAKPSMRLGQLRGATADAGHAVDVVQRGDEAGDGVLTRRASDELESRPRDAIAREIVTAPSPAVTSGVTVPVTSTSQTSGGG